MKFKTVFEFKDYKVFLQYQIDLNKQIQSYKSKLSKAAGCQKSFFSQVLNADAHFAPEHSISLSIFWGLNSIETEYFVTLVQIARAGTSAWREFLNKKLILLKAQNDDLTTRFINKEIINDERKTMIYYSSWQYAAVHILLSIPDFRTPEIISARLQIDINLVIRILKQLKEMGLASMKNEKWEIGSSNIHIPKDSIMNIVNHSNWRSRAMNNILTNKENDIHYTAVHSLSFNDILLVKQRIFEMIDETRRIVEPSKEEELVCISCDFFRI